jgi:hypothetical protein
MVLSTPAETLRELAAHLAEEIESLHKRLGPIAQRKK